MKSRPDPNFLFVYGTLRRDNRHEMYHLLARHAHFVGEGALRGRLFMVEDYPGAVPSDSPADSVRGEVYRLHDPDLVFKQLDAYEDYDPEDPDESLYRRQLLEVQLEDDKSLPAWVYVYNRSTEDLPEIPSGDFMHVADHRH